MPVQTMPDGRELRGTVFPLWARGFNHSFVPFEGATRKLMVHSPIGWSLAHHPDFGVVLRSTFGGRVFADYAALLARHDQGGFLVVSEESLPET